MPPVSQGASVSLACDEQPHRCEVGDSRLGSDVRCVYLLPDT